MSKVMKISVLGTGAFGIAIAISLNINEHEVNLWSYSKEKNAEILKNRQNEKALKGVKIPENVNITDDINCIKDSEIVIIATPSYAVRETIIKIKDILPKNAIIVSLAKGIILEDGEYLVFTQFIKKILGENQQVVSFTGPTHAEEIAILKPSAIVSACEDEEVSKIVQKAFMNEYFRVYTSSDVLGAQLGGAFKNVIAIAAGLSEGMGFGDNSTAALITRGFAEIERLGVKMGAEKETFSGLSGIGDLIVTCMSVHSRNRRAGLLIGNGKTVDEVINGSGSVVEGYYATKYGYELSKIYNVEMPITEGVYNILYKNENPSDVFKSMMNRSAKSES